MGSKSFSKLDRIWKNWLICRQSVHPIVSGSTWFSFLESLLFPGLEMAWTFYFRSIVYWSKFRQKRLATIMRCIIEPKWNTFQPNFQPIYIPNSLCISLSIYFHTFYLFLSFSLSLSLSLILHLSLLSLSLRLVSSLTRLELTNEGNMILFELSEAVQCILAKLETSRTVILPPMVSVLWLRIAPTLSITLFYSALFNLSFFSLRGNKGSNHGTKSSEMSF